MQINFRDVLKLNPSISLVKYMLSNEDSQNRSDGKAAMNFISNRYNLMKKWGQAVRKGNFALVKSMFEENKRKKMLWLSRLHEVSVL